LSVKEPCSCESAADSSILLTQPKGEADWDEIAAIIEEAFRTVAPRQHVAQLDAT
jgi:hypothetical protein